MSLPRLPLTACLAVCIAILSGSQALAMNQNRPPDPLTLQEPATRLSVRPVPGATLSNGYQSPFYRRDAASGAITLQTDAAQPVLAGQRAPATVLREGIGWYYQQTQAEMQADFRVDVFPGNHLALVARIQSAEGPVLDLVADGAHSRIVATLHDTMAHDGAAYDAVGSRSVVVGTLSADHGASVSITSHPDGQLILAVNGTKSVLLISRAATASAMWFEAVAGEVGWHAPCRNDRARVTFTRLSMTRSAP